MNDNELNELIKIRDNAPKGFEMVTDYLYHYDVTYYVDEGDNIAYEYAMDDDVRKIKVIQSSQIPRSGFRSLSDINTIIQLEQQKRELINALDVAVELMYDLDTHGARNTNGTYINLCNFIDESKRT